MPTSISRTDLARNTREIVDQVRQGQPVVVQSYGEEQIVLLDMLDYRILRALVNYALRAAAPESVQEADMPSQVVQAYLDETISLSKAAEQIGISRYELMERFERVGIPLRIGPATLEEAREEVRIARQNRTSTL